MQTDKGGTNLPSIPSSFVGRDREVENLRGLLQHSRLVSVIGTGGVGKTRLALRTATELLADFRDGVWLADLGAISDPIMVPKAVATAMDIREQPGRTIAETLVDLLRRRRLLLVLDNCEHLSQAAAELVVQLLTGCPEMTVLATSRAALRVAGEVAWPLSPLTLPTAEALRDGSDLSAFEAVRLFVERSSQAAPRTSWSVAEVVQIGEIVTRLDGLPLAIELAAARAPVLRPGEILERLGDRLSLLTGGESTAQPRHQTLLATLEWSSAMLAPRERVLLRRLGVFIGGFQLRAAELVTGVDPIEPAAVLDLLTQLIEKSMVVVEPGAKGQSRYRLLETVREYALNQLHAAGEEELMRSRHCDWAVRHAEEAEPHLYRREQLEWLEILELEQPNLRAALAYSQETSDAGLNIGRLASALGWFWYLHGHLTEGRRWLGTAISLAATSPHYARSAALRWTGLMVAGLGDIPAAIDWFEQSAETARTAGDKQSLAHALSLLCFVLRDSGRNSDAAIAAEGALAHATEAGFEWGIAFALYQNGVMAHFKSDPDGGYRMFDEAMHRFRLLGDRLGIAYCLHALSGREEYRDMRLAASMNLEAMGLSEEIGNRRGVCFSLENLAILAARQGNDDEAVVYYRRAVRLWRELGNVHQTGVALAGLGAVLAVGQSKPAAVTLFGASEALMERSGGILRSDLRTTLDYDRALAAARETMGKKAFDQRWAVGRALDLDRAVEFAMTCETGATDQTSRRAAGDPLSRREREVAVMVGRGLTNREIARELVISKQTVDRHVSNILSKLSFGRRAQVATWLAELRRESQNPD